MKLIDSPLAYVAVVVLAACGSSPSGSNVDGAPGGGADTAPTTITIMGTATAPGISGASPVSGATIAAFLAADDSMVTSTTTDASGNFTLTVQLNGAPLDGYVKATLTNYIATYLYPPAPLSANFTGAAVEMASKTSFDLLSTLAQGNQQTGKGLIGLVVEDAVGGTPVAGATVSSSPASTAYRYDGTGSSSLPSSTTSSTQADGVAYMFNTPAGAVTVSATKAGSTFKSHDLKAWADSLTTTLITE